MYKYIPIIFLIVLIHKTSCFSNSDITDKIDSLIELSIKNLDNSINVSCLLIDSSLTLLDNIDDMERRARALNIKGLILSKKRKFQESLEAYNESLEIRVNLKQDVYVADIYNRLGLLYFDMGIYDKSCDFYEKSANLRLSIKDFKRAAISLNNNANSLFYMGKLEDAIVKYQEALDVFDSLDFKEGEISSLIGIGLVFQELENYNKAIESFQDALIISEETNNQLKQAAIYNNIGIVFSNERNYKESINYFKKALMIRKVLGDSLGIINSYNNIGTSYKALDKFDSALIYFNKAFKLNENYKYNYELIQSYFGLGVCLFNDKKYDRALGFFNKALDLSLEAKMLNTIQHSYKYISEIYNKMGDTNKELKYYKLYTIYKDSLYNIESHNKISELQTKYETEKKEHEIVVLTKENQIQKLQINRSKLYFIAALIFIFLISIISLMFIRQSRLKAKSKSAELEQKLLRSQINPHFVFNSLTSIQNLIFEDDKLKAGQYISDFATLMRLILNNSREEFIILDQEIETLKYYLNLQQLRYENKFKYSIKINEDVNTDLIIIPPMIIQPFVENCIKHAFVEINYLGMIDINIIRENKSLKILIIDNGIGRLESERIRLEKEPNHKSLATEITKERLNHIKKRNRNKISLLIKDSISNGLIKGTIVEIVLPVKLLS